MEYARRRFALDKPDPTTGKSRLQTCLDIYKQTGVLRRELRNLPRVPVETEYLWNWYLDLAAQRQAGFSVNALAWSDVEAYFRLRGMSPAWWEVDTIRQIDAAFVASRADDKSDPVQDAGGLMAQLTGKQDHGKR